MHLAQRLRAQFDGLQALITLLEQEREALAVGAIDGERLQQLAADKQAVLAELEDSERARRAAQAEQGYPPGDAGARQAARDADCLKAWQAVRAASERAARLNELAGMMVRLRLQQNQRMLDLIHAVSEKTLYDTRGRSGPQRRQINASA
jgi:flagella synthesis protein FlgN